jgi:Peroxisomal biogenesis factor 11 (PEX11)
LTTSAGLETFLSTTNYALYILAYLHARSPSSSALLQRFLKLAGSQSSISRISASKLEPPKPSPQSPAPFQRLGSLVSDTRTTLRLTALLPLYAWLRQLLGETGSQDRYLRIISLIQCISYIVYQFTENVAFLTDHGIISRKWLGRRAGSGKWWLWSSRAWLAGVSCDFLRLFRQAFIEQERRAALTRTEEEKTDADTERQREINRTWWNELLVASCWLPLSLHYSLEGGLKGVNNGVVGLLGFMAGAQGFIAQWAKTQAT